MRKKEEKMISKELLSEVVGNEVSEIRWINQQKKELQYDVIEDLNYTTINIYELAHKCKEWAKLKNYYLFSAPDENNEAICIVDGLYYDGIYIEQIKHCHTYTEPEAIFEACEWIFEIIKYKQ